MTAIPKAKLTWQYLKYTRFDTIGKCQSYLIEKGWNGNLNKRNLKPVYDEKLKLLSGKKWATSPDEWDGWTIEEVVIGSRGFSGRD